MIVFAGGMIRSGSTLQYNFAREICMMTGGGYIHANEKQDDAVFRHLNKPEWYANKSHHFYDWLPLGACEDGRIRLLMTYRDPRDIMASLLDFRKNTFEEEMVSFKTRVVIHQRLWRAKVNPKYTLRIEYADLIQNPVSHIREICDLLEVELSNQQITLLAQKYSVPVIKETIDKLNNFNAHNRFAPDHIGRVQPGYYDVVLTDDQIRQVEEEVGDFMVENGYELDMVKKDAVA